MKNTSKQYQAAIDKLHELGTNNGMDQNMLKPAVQYLMRQKSGAIVVEKQAAQKQKQLLFN
jgi:hypothetical protein